MRRRSTPQGINTNITKEIDTSSHARNKRREINNHDRAEMPGNRTSSERGRSHGRPEDRDDKNIQGAKTFRRGRIIIFLRQLQVKRSTLTQQLQQPEFKCIEQVISGELKAVDEMIQQFTHLFELREIESDDLIQP
jgi:hypothetical protein